MHHLIVVVGEKVFNVSVVPGFSIFFHVLCSVHIGLIVLAKFTEWNQYLIQFNQTSQRESLTQVEGYSICLS